MDVPISDDSEDVLGRVKFVDDFYSQIRNFPSEDSFVFGLNGPWGSGKTSLLNLLRNRLRKDKKIISLDFNPWYFQSAETITRRFYGSIAHAINQEFFYPQLNSAARRYAQILAPLLKRYGIDFSNRDEADVEEVKRLVESYIAESGRRMIIIVDDLERAQKDELLTVLQIVRLSASFKNTLFILAYDQSQISRQLKRLGVSSEFLEKIVQLPLDIPAADRNEIDSFLIYSDLVGHRSHIDKLLDKLEVSGDRRKEFDKDSAEIYISKLSPFFPTLRNAKRFLIGLSVRLPVVKDEVFLLDFFLLEILRVLANAVYQDIWNNSFYYLPSWTTKVLMASPFDFEWDKTKDNHREIIRKHVELLLRNEPLKDNILEILKALFPPRIKDAFESPTNYADNARATFRANKRLTHPDCFDKYFLLDIPKGTVSDKAVESILTSWAKAPDPESSIRETLVSLGKNNQLVEILDRIVVFLGKVDEKLVKPLLKALSLNIKSVPGDGDRAGYDAQFKLILFLLNDRVTAAEKQTATEAVASEVGPIDVAIRLAGVLTESHPDVIWNLRHAIDALALRGIICERFRREFALAGIDIFKSNCHPEFVLYQIGSYDFASARMINDYVMALFEKEPEYIGKLMVAFSPQPPMGRSDFQFDQLKSIYDVKSLGAIALGAGEKAWSNEIEKRAVETFLRLTGEGGASPAETPG